MAAQLHVVSKRNNAQHAVHRLKDGRPVPELGASSVRVRSEFISLSSNNLSYARGGTMLHWWDAYPIPDGAAAEIGGSGDEWGIVPAWGYATVTESTIPSIPSGSVLWGMWPASGHEVDLHLEAAEPTGHWREVSGQRSKLMAMYNRYQQVPNPPSGLSVTHAATALCKPVWECGYLLNRIVFPASGPDGTEPPTHPLGFGGPWSAVDADLTGAVIISLSASSKTGQGFAWQLARNRDLGKGGPRALLQLSSSPDTLVSYPDSPLAIKSASYGEQSELLASAAAYKPSRVVIVDFGASDAVMESLVAAVVESDIFGTKPSVTIIAVGHEAKVYSDAELQAHVVSGQSLGKVQFNTSGVRDQAMKAIGTGEYFQGLENAWTRCLEEDGFGKIRLKWYEGVGGPEGIEGAWQELCDRTLAPCTGIVIRMSQKC